jgi:hypothetical protein
MNLNLKNPSLWLFIVVSAVLIAWGSAEPPVNRGDGWEYIGMTTSFSNHLTPNLTEQDIQERKELFERNRMVPPLPDYTGYFQDFFGNWYSYHFWFYSFLVTPLFWLIELCNGNSMSAFQLTNIILVLLGFWMLLRSELENKIKVWLAVAYWINPAIFYLNWPHPEIFSYVFVFMSLLQYVQKKPIAAIALSAIASLQNIPIAVLPACMGIMELTRVRKINRRILYASLAASIVLVPFLFYYIFFGHFSLIAESKYASLSYITFTKIVNLFLDLNMGLLPYVPVHLILIIYLMIKRDRTALYAGVMLLLISIVCATQLNWNSGMVYINRYAAWMIPILVFGTLPYVMKLKSRTYLYVAYFLTTGMTMMVILLNPIPGNYLKFHPLARLVMSVAPGLYNPPVEVFVERSIGFEVENLNQYLPIVVTNNSGVRKVLYSGYGVTGYINKGIDLSGGFHVFRRVPGGSDIFLNDAMAEFSEGFHDLENWSTGNSRWMNNHAVMYFLAQNPGSEATITFNLGSFHIYRTCQILFNGQEVYRQVLPPYQDQLVQFAVKLRDLNKLEIKSSEPANAPADFPELNNPDPRSLAFYIMNVNIAIH